MKVVCLLRDIIPRKCHLLITLYKSHGCPVNIVLNLISSEGGGRPLTYILRYNFTQPNFMKLLVVFYNNSRLGLRFRKIYFDFFNNTFPIHYVIINLFHCIWMILYYDDIIKNSRDLNYYYGIFWKIFSTTLMQSFIVLNWFRIYDGGFPLHAPEL